NYTDPACTDFKWHHWAFVYDTTSNPRRRVYIDGILCTTGVQQGNTGNGVYSGSGLVRLGTANASPNRLNAFVQEMRIWNSALTANTIIANMNTVKTGSAAGLVALWPMVYPTTTSILDLTPNNHPATASSSFAAPVPAPSRAAVTPATPVSSTAPIGPDIPEITNAAGGVATSVAANASMPLGVEEYGVIEVDAAGDAVAVLKRGFSLIQGGKWLLAGGYKVANLGLEWIGQVQFAPQLMGYIEGAPPVPGENMTNPLGAYCGASTVAFTCADEVNYAYTAQRDKGFDYSVDMKARFGISAGSSFIATVLGIGTSTEVVKVDWEAGIASEIEGSTSVVNGATAAFTLSQTQLNQTDLQGYFYNAGDGLGARFVPLNVGSAFVKSSTADLYALRLLSNSALVGYQMVPDLNIPPDWNIITFPINPFYTRQGCLDGRFGYWDKNSTFTVKTDPFFPAAASGADASYHRVAEAYALKSQIDREHQQLYNQYADNDAVAQGSASWVDANRAKASMSKYVPGAGNRPALSLGSSTPVTKGQGSAGDAASDPTQLVKRNLCNTYVWTAYGGLYAETEESLDGFTETHGGGYQFKGLAGLSMEGNASVAPA
ncbi:LamG-like jellyroll fold domain-containing protein, partial [Nannocystis sp.]|uniref:LamG-like jellyroll fold domain-containing protein n=1 Tax=Nannocystis sp. TaxID=1962667 RepID=UPI0025F2E606